MYQSSLRTFRQLLLLADSGAALVAMLIALRVAAAPMQPDLLVGAVAAFLIGVWSLRGYDLTRVFRIADEIVTVLFGGLIALALVGGELFFLDAALGRRPVLLFGGLAVAISMALRIAIREVYKWRRTPRLPRSRVLVVGSGANGQAVAAQLREREWLGIELMGLADVRETPDLLEEVEARVQQDQVDAVVVTLPLERTPGLSEFVERLHGRTVHVYLLPELHPLAALPSRMEMFGGMALLSLSEQIMTPVEASVKRLMDVLVALLALATLMPLLLLIALLVRLSGPGPILYGQDRVGERGRRFQMYKFRTMIPGADSQRDEAGAPFHKRPDDPRVTPVGRWLRRFSLDELPQFWNILRGEMSLVGPRPELPTLVARYEPWQRRRLLVPQGLTGWWQINGRSDNPMELHTDDDLYYIRNFSLLLDLEILWKTIWVVLRGRGAY